MMNSDCAAMSTPASSRRASLMGGTARDRRPSSSASGCMIMDTPTPMITSTTVELAGLGSIVSR